MNRRLGASLGRRMARSMAGGPQSPPVDSTLAVLMGLPTLKAYFDKDWTDGLSLRSSGGIDYLTGLLDRREVYTVAQASPDTAQPVWGATTPTGRKVATYTAASSQYLVGASGLVTEVGSAGSFTVFTVAKFASLAASRGLWSFGNLAVGGSPQRCQLQALTNGALQFTRVDGVGNDAITSSAAAVGTSSYHVITATYDAAVDVVVVRVDGSQVGTGASARNPTFSLFAIGGVLNGASIVNFMDGQIAATLVCGSVLGSTDLANAEAALTTRYKTP